jgi:hypothetical protein
MMSIPVSVFAMIAMTMPIFMIMTIITIMPSILIPMTIVLPPPPVPVQVSMIDMVIVWIWRTRFIDSFWNSVHIMPGTTPRIGTIPIAVIVTPPDSLIEPDIFTNSGCIINSRSWNQDQSRLGINRGGQDESELNLW